MDIVNCSGIREGIFSLSFKTGPICFFKKLTKVLFGAGVRLILVDISIWIGRWSSPSAVLATQVQAGRQLDKAMLRSGAVLCKSVSPLLVDFY